MLMVFSVGGGNLKKKVSVNIVKAIKYAKVKKSIIWNVDLIIDTCYSARIINEAISHLRD